MTTPAGKPVDPDRSPILRWLLHPDRAWQAIQHSHLLPWLALAANLILAGTVLAAGLVRRRRHQQWSRSATVVRVLPPPEADLVGAEVFWSRLTALKHPRWKRLILGQPPLAFEYLWRGRELTLQVWVPATIPAALVERAAHAAWPGCQTTTAPAAPPLPLHPPTPAEGGAFRPQLPDWYPLAADFEVDPLRSLLTAGPTLPGQSACLQILCRPATGRRAARAYRAANALHAGTSHSPTGRLLDLLAPTAPTSAPPQATKRNPQHDRDVRAILDKAALPHWETAIRYAVAGDAPRPVLKNHANEIAGALAVYTGRNYLRRLRVHAPLHTLAGRRLGRGFLLSVPELAAIAHLPTDITVPGLARAGARNLPPPVTVASGGRNTKVVGVADTSGNTSGWKVAAKVADLRHHLQIVGPTGVGKTVLLLNLILADIRAGRGVVVIDPNGDLILDLLDRLPEAALAKTVILDPRQEHPPALNPLDEADPDLAVDNIVAICRRIWERHWGPRTDDVLRAACHTLLRGPYASLHDIPALLNDREFRRPYLATISDPAGLGGFWAWYERLGDPLRAQVIGPVLSKLRAFLMRGFVRDVVSAPRSSFSMTTVLDGGVLLARLPKGELGEETSKLLGSFVLAKAWQAATLRARQPEQRRRDAALYVDEAHNFLNLPHSFDDVLAEARKYRLSLTLAHQHLAQLPRDLRDAISANARNKIMFNLSPEDAHQLARHVSPDLTEHDLAHLDAYQAAVRLVVDGREQPAFTLRTLPAPDPIAGRAAEARRTCRALFAGQAPPRRLTTRPDLPPPASTGRRQGGGSEGGPAGRSGDGSGGRPSSAPPSGRKPAGQEAREGADRNPDSPGGEAR